MRAREMGTQREEGRQHREDTERDKESDTFRERYIERERVEEETERVEEETQRIEERLFRERIFKRREGGRGGGRLTGGLQARRCWQGRLERC